MNIIIQIETSAGGHMTDVYPTIENAGFKELKAIVEDRIYESLVRDNPDITEEEELEEEGEVSYNDEKVKISEYEANADTGDSWYTWEIAKINQQPIHVTVVTQNNKVYTLYADQPTVQSFEVLNLDTEDEDEMAVNCSIMDSMRDNQYEVARWSEEE